MQLDSMMKSQAIKRNGRLVSLNFRVPLDVRRKLRMLAAERDVTMNALLMEALEQVVTGRGDPVDTGFSVGDPVAR